MGGRHCHDFESKERAFPRKTWSEFNSVDFLVPCLDFNIRFCIRGTLILVLKLTLIIETETVRQYLCMSRLSTVGWTSCFITTKKNNVRQKMFIFAFIWFLNFYLFNLII